MQWEKTGPRAENPMQQQFEWTVLGIHGAVEKGKLPFKSCPANDLSSEEQKMQNFLIIISIIKLCVP